MQHENEEMDEEKAFSKTSQTGGNFFSLIVFLESRPFDAENVAFTQLKFRAESKEEGGCIKKVCVLVRNRVSIDLRISL